MNLTQTPLTSALGSPIFMLENLPDSAFSYVGVVEFDCTQPLEHHLDDCRFDEVDKQTILSHFTLEGDGLLRKQMSLLKIGADKQPDEIEQIIESIDPTRPWEGSGTGCSLAFSKRWPDEQRKYSLPAFEALGLVSGKIRTLYLGGNGNKRCLYTKQRVETWSGTCVFLLSRDALPSEH